MRARRLKNHCTIYCRPPPLPNPSWGRHRETFAGVFGREEISVFEQCEEKKDKSFGRALFCSGISLPPPWIPTPYLPPNSRPPRIDTAKRAPSFSAKKSQEMKRKGDKILTFIARFGPLREIYTAAEHAWFFSTCCKLIVSTTTIFSVWLIP